MITMRINRKNVDIEPSILTEPEICAYISECENSIATITHQLSENERNKKAGLMGNGETWVPGATEARRIYEMNIAQLKTAIFRKRNPGVEYADVFMNVAKDLLDTELFKRLQDETQDRIISA